MKSTKTILTQIIPDVRPSRLATRQIEREFFGLVDAGASIRTAGSARANPHRLFETGQRPKHKIEIFGTRFYLTAVRQIPELRFFVAYVVQPIVDSNRDEIFPRIIYKDLSLAWRSASHLSYTDGELWVGKGDVRDGFRDGYETTESDEATTDMPLEMQSALEKLSGSGDDEQRNGKATEKLLDMILRTSPSNRIEPFRDFTDPRRKAAANPANLINRGRSIARFRRKNDPKSLQFTTGFEPDLESGIVAQSTSTSRLYGGKLKRFRILSTNRQIQYYFMASRTHVWIFPPQSLSTELSSYGVRTISVAADEDLFLPGFEYHYFETTKNGEELYSQIPIGFAGEACPFDDHKADASPWLDQIPIIQKFRQVVLKKK